MLRPALLYKDELERLFIAEMYTDRYFYYSGGGYYFELPNIRVEDGVYQWAIVQNDKVLGYFTYSVNALTDNVYNVGLYSFDDGNVSLIAEVFKKMEELVSVHHRVEWRVISGNHCKRGYDSFCKRYGGSCFCLHDVTRDAAGEYHDEYIYEVVRNERQ